MEPGLTLGAVYERTVAVSLERVWENVHDWEHLPWLHASSFSGIELEEAGDWGWRARVQVPGGEGAENLLIELRRDPDRDVYHTRTLEGSGRGADTVVTLSPKGERSTHVRVEFWLPIPAAEQARALGSGLVQLYTRLWDEDEAMMVRRQAVVDGALSGAGEGIPAESLEVPLGPWADLPARLPLRVSSERGEYRVVETAAGLRAHPTRCPHRGGPLEQARIIDGHVVCPWHGYRFSLEDGRAADGRPCRMRSPPRVERRPDGQAQLVIAPLERAGQRSRTPG
jgi:nitrite reductase/ring-hydroxylating ferredoxin subunit/uncharacterized protein YndB with AHSA1/START domain